MSKKYLFFGILFGVLLFLPFVVINAIGPDDCKPGYKWDRGAIKCAQENCNDIPDAHWSYTSDCVCGTSGSIYEDPNDPNKECYYDADYAACPGCVYACVGLDEPCPDEDSSPGRDDTTRVINVNQNANGNKNTNSNQNKNVNATNSSNQNQNTNTQEAGTNIPLSTQGTTAPACQEQCNKYLRGKKNARVISVEGTPPDCECQIDVNNDHGLLTQTIVVEGDNQTTYTFDPASGNLIGRNRVNRREEIERIRQRLGYRYTQEEIDTLLDPDKVDEWFNTQIKPIKTETRMWHPQFWWQHVVAVLDHGFNGNSAQFVDVNQFGRCGDSMQWLERNLSSHLQLGDDPDQPGQKHEAMLSITGERYSNLLNHTSIMIRPSGISNSEWEDIVKELKNLSGGAADNPGIKPNNLQNIDPRLLDAKVIDPYKKEITTVREFIKGWSYIRIS